MSKNWTLATGFTAQCVSKTGHELLSIQQLPVQGATVQQLPVQGATVQQLPVQGATVQLRSALCFLSLYCQYIRALFVFARHSPASTSIPSLSLLVTLLPAHLCPLCISPSFYCQYICALFALAHHSTASTSVPSLCLSITLLPVHLHALFVFVHHSTASTSVPSFCLSITLPPVHLRALFVFVHHSTASTSVPSLCLSITLLPVHLCPLSVCPSLYCQYTCVPSSCLSVTLPPVHPYPLRLCLSLYPLYIHALDSLKPRTDNDLSILFSLCIARTAGARGVAVHGRLQGTQPEPRCQGQHTRADQQRGGGADAGGGASRRAQVALVQQPQQFQPARSTVLHWKQQARGLCDKHSSLDQSAERGGRATGATVSAVPACSVHHPPLTPTPPAPQPPRYVGFVINTQAWAGQ